MIEILKQGPRLRAEAAQKTLDVNEAYLMVHNSMARAMNGIASAKRKTDPQAVKLARAVVLALRQPITSGEIKRCAAF